MTRAADLLRAGKLVAFGTETVYGLGADATNAARRGRDFRGQGPAAVQSADLPLSVGRRRVPRMSSRMSAARLLAEAFWPGPLTLVLPRRPDCPVALLTGAGLDTLAVRVPGHAVALSLLRRAGRPIAAPSANRSGQVSPTSARHVLDGLAGRIAAVLDSGPCQVGVESTVLDLSGPDPVLLRPGGVTVEDLEALHRPHPARDAACRGRGAALSRPDGVALRAGFAGAAGCGRRSRTMRRCWRSGRRCQAGDACFSSASQATVDRKRRPACSRGCAGLMRMGCGRG